MGEAKRRGPLPQRQAAAQAASRARFPASVTCNNCEAALFEIEPLDIRGFPGMRLAGVAQCKGCNSSTWALDGTADGLRLFQQCLSEFYGREPE